jgi:DNA helicase-2/ATP-dependent DNA helicase PcrA
MLGVLRAVCSTDDYVALRLILGCKTGVGVRICRAVVERVVANNLNYGAVFRDALPVGAFSGRLKVAIDGARDIIQTLAGWTGDDVLGDRRDQLGALLLDARSAPEAAEWEELTAVLPDGMTLTELRDYIWTDNQDQRHNQVTAVHERLGLDPPAAQLEPGIRVMTMHGAKGLQGKVVFIPGLEEQVLPSARNAQRAGLVLEAARLLYVSITRAQAAVILTWAGRRYIAGASVTHRASRYAAHLGGVFQWRDDGLTPAETTAIVQAVHEMG